jgi:hypothetical protein
MASSKITKDMLMKNKSLAYSLRRLVTEEALSKMCTNIDRNFEMSKVDYIAMSALCKAGLVKQIKVGDWCGDASVSELIALFKLSPSEEMFHYIKSRTLGSTFLKFILSNFDIVHEWVDLGVYSQKFICNMLNGGAIIHPQLARKLIGLLPGIKGAHTTRRIVSATISHLTLEDLNSINGMTTKEVLGIIASELRKGTPMALVIDDEFVKYISKNIFKDTISGITTSSRVLDRNLQLIRQMAEGQA